MSLDSKPECYAPAPFAYRLAHWSRFAFPRRVVEVSPPMDLGLGLRVVVTLSCKHSFHVKPRKRRPSWKFCAACALKWLKGKS